MANIDDIQKKLKGDKPESKPAPRTEKLKKEEKPVKGKNGGRRPGSGRKTLEKTIIARGLIDNAAKLEEEIEIQDPVTGIKRKVKKPRVVWAMDTFFRLGMYLASKNDIAGVQSLKEFMDRAVGRSAQPIRGDGEDDPPIKIGVNIGEILKKAYGNKGNK